MCPVSNEPVCVRRILQSAGCALKTDLRSKTIPLSGILPCKGRPPIRRAWTIVPDFELRRRGTSTLETSLWLAAQRDHKFCAGTRLRTQRFVRYDQGGSWRHLLCNKIERVLRNCDPIERCFRAFQVAYYWRDIPLVFLCTEPLGSSPLPLGRPLTNDTKLHRIWVPVRSIAVKIYVPIGRSASRTVIGISSMG